MANIFISSVATISLFVGGIGVMNIMLVSVTERTKEIGIRKAIGAKNRDILLQFLIEALTLTIIGGVLGLSFGYLGANVVGHFIKIKPILSIDMMIIAVSVSSAIGLVFGVFPAMKASKLNPIDALRHE
jgi:putative ABC transport system permease protein